ncbi:hypothetical protein BDY19DRAFT_903435 [Irpex rosettiformis]|uniref:Uncharacterized protein n=1 Tax=Irpex rosettiformis TaxID=378272 RepID=A0ACB8UET2_9APHY|nr:hypothetical protein BDY19DRAFT_903435 [Irpex rosettiformis]
MVASTRSKTRKEQKAKATPAAGTQRLLRDMFVSTTKQTGSTSPIVVEGPVTEVLDSGSEAEVVPTAPEETMGGRGASDVESIASIAEAIVVPIQPAQPPPPKKLFSIFERPKPAQEKNEIITFHENDPNVIYLSDNDSCTEDPTPYERRPGQHLFSVSSSSSNNQGKQNMSRQGINRETPIVIDGRLTLRPAKTTSSPSNKPVYSIFASKQKAEPQTVPTISGQPVPFPDRESQHVYGPRVTFPQKSSCFPRSTKGKEPMRLVADHECPLGRVCYMQQMSPELPHYLELAEDTHAYIETMPHADRTVPSISRVLRYAETAEGKGSSSDSPRENWTDKWRPRRAEHVLGNEAHASYLRDWLTALRLQDNKENAQSSLPTVASAGKKRKLAHRKKPRIVRHVKKRRRGDFDDAMHDFLASDESTDFEEEPLTAPSSDFDELAFSDAIDGTTTDSSRGSSPLTGLSEDEGPTVTSPPSLPPRRFGRQLMNTILLAGPHGSGKTAAVYACAEELGYEVFEVYPGIGERNGASLHKLVGDVGKNHVVKVRRQRASSAQSKIFRKAPARQYKKGLLRVPDSSDVESVADELDIISSEPDEPFVPELPQPTTINQSLILVEEVDILYQTDSNFWPALINIIKDCKRPVILTCNGRLYPRQELTRIYQNFDTKLYPIYDLRHAIDRLQFLSTKIPTPPSSHQSPVSSPSQGSTCIPTAPNSDSSMLLELQPSDPPTQQDPNKKQLQVLRNMDYLREIQSFVDAHLCRETNSTTWNLHLADTLLPTDDELGYTVLHSDRDLDYVPVSSYHDQDESITEHLVERSHHVFLPHDSADEPYNTIEVAGLEYNRHVYLATAGVILRSLSSSHAFVTDAALHLDFAPAVRSIMELEQIHEAYMQASQSGIQGRTTRNSQRTDSWRWLPLNETERATFWNTRASFLVVEHSGDRTCEMDKDPTSYGAKSASNGPESNVQNEISSLSTAPSRHSPVLPLAPLKYLQNQRRGSITDPSLHAASTSNLTSINTTALNSSNRPWNPELLPPSGWFEYSWREPEVGSRKLFRTKIVVPLVEVNFLPSDAKIAAEIQAVMSPEEPTGGRGSNRTERMDVDSQSPITLPRPDELEHNGRRQSLAGTKRKMSPDHGGQAPSGPDNDSPLIGPGVGISMDAEGPPAPKRRSSAFDTRLAQLDIRDRRNSVDGRGGGQPLGGGSHSQMWNHGREGPTPVFANTPLTAGGYTTTPSSAFPADSPPGRVPHGITTFAWNQPGEQTQQSGSPQHPHEANMANNASGPYDSGITMLPPSGTFPQDRRMSAPNISPDNISPPSSSGGPTRGTKSRSRPSSRARANNPSTASGSTEQSPGPSSANPEDSPVTPSHQQPLQRESGSTPYSRSPELRISHKLAERKRRKEMKDLFDELQGQLPSERQSRQSKWEILSKAIDFISTLKQSHQEMIHEIEILRHELDGYRQGIPFPPGGGVVYGHPSVGVPPFAHPPGPGVPPPPPPTVQNPSQSLLPRPGSSQNMYPPGSAQQPLPHNGTPNPSDPRTDTPT